MKDVDVFSMYGEIQGRKIILGKIDREQVLDNHQQVEAVLLHLRKEGDKLVNIHVPPTGI